MHPSAPNYVQLRTIDQRNQQKQKSDFDKRHASQRIASRQSWLIEDQNVGGSIVKECSSRPYLVRTERGKIAPCRQQE